MADGILTVKINMYLVLPLVCNGVILRCNLNVKLCFKHTTVQSHLTNLQSFLFEQVSVQQGWVCEESVWQTSPS